MFTVYQNILISSLLPKLYMSFDSINYILSFLIELVTINNLIGLVLFSLTILFAGKTGKVLDGISKVIGIGAGSTIIYNNWIAGSGSSSGSGSDNNKDDDKNKNKNDKNKNDNNKNDEKTKKSNK